METVKKTKMLDSLTEDLWTIILSKLPIRTMTTLKLVCKQWKSILESPFLRELFLSHHENSRSSWSLMCGKSHKEVVAHYGCETWGLQQSLGSYISSFLVDRFKAERYERIPPLLRLSVSKQKVRVVAYTDVGLILVRLKYSSSKYIFYVANPISRQCVQIPHLPDPHIPPPIQAFGPSGLVTRIENDNVLGYKVVLMEKCSNVDTNVLRLLIYSSETGEWSYNAFQCPITLRSLVDFDPVSLNGNLYWIGHNLNFKDVVVSYDFYATGMESDRCKVSLFPDMEKRLSFRRACTSSRGSLMYTNIVHENLEHKLCVWRLKAESGEWQLVSEISPACIKSGFDYLPLAINPFDADTIYLWSKMHKCLASTNLYKGKFGLHNNLERSTDGRTLTFAGECRSKPYFSMFVLPRWLYRIACPPS